LKVRQLKVLRANHTGFCFGVKRAIAIADNFLKKNRRAYSLGPIIHNPIVVEQLAKRGLKVIYDIKKAKGAHVVVRSHGISPRLREKAKALSIGMIDATCPFVKRSQTIVTLLKKQGYRIVIVGEKGHPEVKALFEIARPNCIVAAKETDFKKLKNPKKIAAVAQTTLSQDKFFKLASSILRLNSFECRIFNTICNDVAKRQAEARDLADNTDIVLVIGGRMSANTRYLAQICRERGTSTYQIETEDELKRSWFKGRGCVGIISGSSTPDEIVDKVVEKLKGDPLALRPQDNHPLRRKRQNVGK
jgi:4-hydroxy-3-methylbut-2-enyl diphosphate reductase